MWVRGIQTGCGETGEFDSSFQTEDKHEHPFFLSESENASSPEGKHSKKDFQGISSSHWVYKAHGNYDTRKFRQCGPN